MSCFIDQRYEMGNKMAGATLRLSHVEIVTFDGMCNFTDQFLRDEEGVRNIFPSKGITDAYHGKKKPDKAL